MRLLLTAVILCVAPLLATDPVLRQNAVTIAVTNSGTGTTTNKLAKIPAGSATVLTTSAADVISAVGVVISGAGTSGSATIGVLGQFSCLFDNTATTAGDFITPSSTTAGTCHDAGTAYPTTGEIMGQVLSSNASCGSPPCGPYTVVLGTPDVFLPGAGGSTGNSGNSNNKGSQASGLIRTCEIVVGDPGAASAVLANDNDTPDVCANDTGATFTITAVHCYADAGSPTVTPIITGGSGTSILSGALTCSQTQGGAAGTLNGTPTQTNGQTIDANITTAGGTAKYIVLRITRTL